MILLFDRVIIFILAARRKEKKALAGKAELISQLRKQKEDLEKNK